MIRTGPARALVGRERAFRQLAIGAGCIVEETADVAVEGHVVTSVLITCPDNDVALVLLNLLADYYGREDPRVRSLAAQLADGAKRAGYPRDKDFMGRAIHRFVSRNVSFEEEATELFRAPDVTLRIGFGDCDDHAVLCAAIAKACGIHARVTEVRGASGEITHVLATLRYGGRDYPCETTLAQQGGALYGEAPLDAVRRLGVRTRPDVG